MYVTFLDAVSSAISFVSIKLFLVDIHQLSWHSLDVVSSFFHGIKCSICMCLKLTV